MITHVFARISKKISTALLLALSVNLVSLPAVSAPAKAASAPAPAQLPWICPQLDNADNYQKAYLFLRKGKGDWLFRDRSDLVTVPPITQTMLGDFARVKKGLEKANVRLVVFIAPPRGALMRDYVDFTVPAARNFSPDVAMGSYLKTVQRLRDYGISVTDVMPNLKDANLRSQYENSPYYLAADQHWTPYGAHITAIALARDIAKQPGYAKLSKTNFATTLTPPRPTDQVYRQEAQRICKTAYKPDVRRLYETRQASADASTGLLDSGDVEVALVGTSFSIIPGANFSGFLRQELHADVANYGIGGGGLDASIVSYLLSEDYARTKPKFLVWEMQYHNLKEADTFAYISGAVDGDCGNAALVKGKPVPVKMGETPLMTYDNGQRSKLRGAANLVVNLTSPDARRYHVLARYTDGRQDRFDIDASNWSHSANKMIIRLPRDGGDLAGVSLVPDQRLSGTVSAHVCRASA